MPLTDTQLRQIFPLAGARASAYLAGWLMPEIPRRLPVPSTAGLRGCPSEKPFMTGH